MIRVRCKRKIWDPAYWDRWVLWCKGLNLDPEGAFEVVDSFEQLVNNLEEPPEKIYRKFFIFRELPARDPLTNEVKKRQHYTQRADAFEVLNGDLVKGKLLGDYS